MKSVPELIANLSPDSELFQGVMAMVRSHEQNATMSRSALASFFEQLIDDYSSLIVNQCQVATELTEHIFADSDTSDYFVLTPVPDGNSPEKFTSAVDLLVLRWPLGKFNRGRWMKNNVLDISESSTRDDE